MKRILKCICCCSDGSEAANAAAAASASSGQPSSTQEAIELASTHQYQQVVETLPLMNSPSSTSCSSSVLAEPKPMLLELSPFEQMLS